MKKSTLRSPFLCAVIATASSVLLASSSVAGPETFGVYRGAGGDASPDKGVSGIASFEKWFGANPNARALDFYPSDSWSNMKSTWMLTPWKNQTVPGTTRKYSPTWGMAMLPRDGVSNIADGAAGAYTGGANGTDPSVSNPWRAIATNLKTAFSPTAANPVIIRLGAEFNLHNTNNPSPYELTPSNYTQWKAYWRLIVTEMRKVSPDGFLFDWNMVPGPSNVTDPATGKKFLLKNGYPGDDVVDIIGMDAYNASWPAFSDPAARWTWIYGAANLEQGNATQCGQGIAYWIQFAKDRPSPRKISFPEWGTGVRPNDSNAGGDDPYYVQKMHETMVANASILRYHDYWDYEASDFNCRLSNDNYSASGRMFRRLFQEFYPIRDVEVLSAKAGTTSGTVPNLRPSGKEVGFNGGAVYTGTGTTASYSGGEGSYLDATKSGDWVEYTVPNVAAGTYTVVVGVKKNPSKGQFKLLVGRADDYLNSRSPVGGTVDTYATSDQFTGVSMGTWTAGTSGDKIFHFESVGRLSSSGGNQLAFDYIKLIKQ